MAKHSLGQQRTPPPHRLGAPARVWELISTYGPNVADLCRAGERLLPGFAGIGLSAGGGPSGSQIRFTSDDTSSRIEAFQHTLDEGPCRDATATRRPVMVPNLTTGSWRQRWPQFTPAALNAGVGAVFALPLHAGGVRHDGAIDLYRRRPGGLDGIERTDALVFAAAAAELLTLEELGLNLTDAFTHGRQTDSLVNVVATPIKTGSGVATAASVVLACWFDLRALIAVREHVHLTSASEGLTGDDLYLFVLSVHEAMTNAVRHGGGHGQLLLWSHADHLRCEISDHGSGIPDTYLPARQPDTRKLDGRGLWLIRRSCTSCKVTTDATGTRLLLGHRVGQQLWH